MTKRILIDAQHPEEVRMVMTDDSRLEEFDFEIAARKQIKGNIYLAKVTRVEPSLQAAFVEYGGNKQGFLPFSEIHVDYYQIPVADKEKLRAALQEDVASIRGGKGGYNSELPAADDDEEEDGGADTSAQAAKGSENEAVEQKATEEKPVKAKKTTSRVRKKKADDTKEEGSTEAQPEGHEKEKEGKKTPAKKPRKPAAKKTPPKSTKKAEDDGVQEDIAAGAEVSSDEDTGSTITDEDVAEIAADKGEEVELFENENEDLRVRRSNLFRRYKIQEVIKRNQIVLVQVIKEERGNKGASLTTYITLAGRYCVYMPNTPGQGGVSRRIANIADRKRLKSMISEIDIDKGSSVIIRTAGVGRRKSEIQRDYEYLYKLWDDIRKNTLSSEAPALVHKEGDIIIRAMRDIYTTEVEEVLVEGDQAYKTARDYMKQLMPTHVAKVKEYKDVVPLFRRYKIEQELDKLHENSADLPSGGSIVMAPTEALVAIDVNSGKSTRGRSIEETAVQTNIEAAKEIARQIRLRDLAGLVVIDFIDMLHLKNKRAVEKALKEALKSDRAKIQLGRISMFGLLEMSRQRLRSSLFESSTVICPRCNGRGVVRAPESTALMLLRAIEGDAGRGAGPEIVLRTSEEAAMYMLNNKHEEIMQIEQNFNIKVRIVIDHKLIGADFHIDGRRGVDRKKNRRGGGSENKGKRPHQHQSQHQNSASNYESSSPKQEDEGQEDGETGTQRHQKPRYEGGGNREGSPHHRHQGGKKHNNNRRRNRPYRPNADGATTVTVSDPVQEEMAAQQAAGVAAAREYHVEESVAPPARMPSAPEKEPENATTLRGLWKKITQ